MISLMLILSVCACSSRYYSYRHCNYDFTISNIILECI